MAKSYFGVPVRDPYESERDFFLNNRNVAGYAADDDAVVLNPFSIRSPEEKDAVGKNEALRVLLRTSRLQPQFELTPSQQERFKTYSENPVDINHTLFSRIITGDPSAEATQEQKNYAHKVFMSLMQERFAPKK